MKKLFLFFLLCLPASVCSAQTEEAADGMLAIPVVNINTDDGTMPTCAYVAAPQGCWGHGSTGNDYVSGHMTVCIGDSVLYDSGEYAEDENGKKISGMRIRIRGNSSAQRAFPAYRIKLSKKGDPLQFGHKEKAWNLIRPMSSWGKDYYLLDFHIGREVSLVAGMPWQPVYKFVELYINGDYRGIYLLADVIERGDDRIDVGKTGFIAEADAYWWNEDSRYQFHTPHQVRQLAYTFKYPEPEGFDADPTVLPAIESYFNMVEDKLYAGACDLGECISLKSFAAWHWAHDLLGTKDTGGANMYFHKKNMVPDSLMKSKLKIGPLWDFDSNFALNADEWCYHHRQNYAYGSELFKREDFVRRYLQLCQERLPLVQGRIQALADSLRSTFGSNLDEAIVRHNRRCDETMPSLAQQAEYVGHWFEQRVDWISGNCQSLTKAIVVFDGCSGAVASGSNVRYYTLTGQLAATSRSIGRLPQSLQPGTYIMVSSTGTKKIVVQ